MIRIRWAAVVFAALQVATYYLPYPPGVLGIAIAIVALLAIGNAGVWVAYHRAEGVRGARTVQVASLLLDGLVVMGLVFVYTFDPDTAMWAVIYILPLEGAIKFALPGSLITMGVATAVYTVRELYGQAAYGTPFLPTSVSFRMGVGFIIAGVAGAMASSLIRDRDELELAKAEVERSAGNLEEALEQLRAATAVKDEFLAMTNHELRTPLTTILGYAQTLHTKWQVIDEDQRREFVDHISHQGKRLHALVEDLLTLSSAQAGALDIQARRVPLCDAVAEAIAQNGLRAAGVRNECDEDIAVLADFDRLTQVLTNLISNALKYGGEPIVVSAHDPGDGTVSVTVTDSGDGVPDRFVPHLFEKFSQASRGVSRTAEGTGLGLAIVQELVEAQGGTVWYERNEPTGARFCVRLPAAAAQQEQPVELPAG
jgi:signal transduction histidine kinase